MESHDDIYYEAVKALGENYRFFDKRAWAEWVVDTDGLGPTLAHYDGMRNCEDLDGIEFWIFKQN